MITKIIIDYIFSAIAGMGFGIVFNPPFKVLLFSGLFAGAGHSLRLLLMAQYSVNIFVATLVSAFFIGILGFLMGGNRRVPVGNIHISRGASNDSRNLRLRDISKRNKVSL